MLGLSVYPSNGPASIRGHLFHRDGWKSGQGGKNVPEVPRIFRGDVNLTLALAAGERAGAMMLCVWSSKGLRGVRSAALASLLLGRKRDISWAGGKRLSQTATGGDHRRPLDGVRVLDLTRVLAGPFATMLLGDLGAEVIKVEKPEVEECCVWRSPDAGDDTRAWGPPFVGSESVYFLSVNRNKKSIAVDLKHPRGLHVVQQLSGMCDVLMENFVPGKLSALGLGYEQLSGPNPALIYCSISGYGQTGPHHQRPGYDSIASALSGMMHITGSEEGDPVRPGIAMTDLATGLYAHGAVLAALLQRQRTGRGAHIDCDLLSSQVSCLSHVAANFLNGEKEARRWGTAHESIVPYQAFKTKDGHVVIAAGNDQQFVNLCHVLRLPELSQQPRYSTNKLRVQNRQALVRTLAQRFLQETTTHWLGRFEGSGVPIGPINSIREVFSDPQVKHNGLMQEMEHPTAGHITVPGPAVRYSGFSHGDPMPPPVIGQHTVQVLRDALAYPDDVISELLASGAVAQNSSCFLLLQLAAEKAVKKG
ncbi:succinate--hydroxymethylglutarate CoA-transferase isoform X3 [Syngnathus typhle]|uniref:succinate--hydroxymethylglutarate CoA-transferase isoform X3 n=1 Tax=Syngnathus typhle TaxID=161592 RepID=UPI002A6B120A|nr:succinate--hydroxymethylglutarate CoA-transferase isoform X3 [Syngnathus typhle]